MNDMRRLALLGFICVFAVSCGGGGSEPAGSVQNGNSGNISYSYSRASQLKPAVFSNSNGAVITGLTGANFTKIQLNPIKSMAATKIACSVDGQLWMLNSDGSNPQPFGPSTQFFNGQTVGSWYPNGTLLAFGFRDSAGNAQIYRINADGTGLLKLTSFGTFGAGDPAWAPSGLKLAFDAQNPSTGDNNIYTINPDGSGLTQLTPGTSDDSYPQWSPDSTKIYCMHRNASLTYDIASVPAGGSTTFTTEHTIGVSSPSRFAVSPLTGEAAYVNPTRGLTVGFFGSTGAWYTFTTPPSGSQDSSPSFSPDGQMVVFTRSSATSSTLWTKHSLAFDEAETPISDANRPYFFPTWGPFPGNRTLVGTGGILGANASGFLFGQVFDVTQSVLAFACTTPGTATITQQSGGGNVTNAVFQISGDAITSLKYIADVYSQPTQIIPGSFTTATGALVSFNTATGRVSLVAPYSSAKRVISAKAVAFDGQFLGVWKDGKKVSGATTHVAF